MCVICKQARRSGRQWGGMTDACWLPAAALPGARREGPPPRCGKRAFVRAVAQQPGGTRRSEVHCPLLTLALNVCPVEALHQDADVPGLDQSLPAFQTLSTL